VFRALLAHPQEALHKRHLVYCMRIMSVGCSTLAIENQGPLHVLNITCSSSGGAALMSYGILRAYNVSWL
jgi:hypothetical protein